MPQSIDIVKQLLAPRQPPQPAGSGAPGGIRSRFNPVQPTPAAAPMARPQEKIGLKVSAQANIHIAMNLLEEALPAFGSESREGQKILQSLKILGTLGGSRESKDLVPASVMQMVSQLPQMGGGSDMQRAIMQQMQQKPPGTPPGTPLGMPPGMQGR